MRVNPEELNADFLVIAGHKFHGPMGVGVLWIRSGVEIEPFLVGGGQERRRRAGTENVAAIVGLGEACDLAHRELVERADHLRTLRDRFEEQVLAQVPGSFVHCAQSPRLPNTCSLRLEGLRAQELLIRLDLAGFAVSTGSACASGAVEPSPTLLALGMNATQALGTLRISFGMPNSVAEVDALAEALRREVSRLREVAAAQTSHAPRATPTRQQGVAQPSRTAKAKPSSRVAP
jgi:cysteine desulfurase